MLWSRIGEQSLYHIILQFLINGWQPITRIFILISLVFCLWRDYRAAKQTTDEKKLLQELNRLLSLIEAGNSPRYSLEQVEIPTYPDYLTHPEDDYFNPLIFKRQVDLFEKKILVQTELEADFAIVRYRMTIMKFLPLLIMIGLQRWMNAPPITWMSQIIIAGFLISFYLADWICQS